MQEKKTSKKKRSKMTRQLSIYYMLIEYTLLSPKELMMETGITNRRMLERDLKDLRDCGLINAQYDRRMKRYYFEDVSFDESVDGPRRAHLLRLYRLGTLIRELSQNEYSSIEDYEEALKKYQTLKKEAKENTKTGQKDFVKRKEKLQEAAEDVALNKDFINKYDLVKEYYELFPESNERTRQRDFKEINLIPNFRLYYDKRLKNHIYYIIGILDEE